MSNYDLIRNDDNALEEMKNEDIDIYLLLERILDDEIALTFDFITLYKLNKSINILKKRLDMDSEV